MPRGEGRALRFPPVAAPLVILGVAVLAGGGWLLMTKQQQLDRANAELARSRQQIEQLEGDNESLTAQLQTSQNELRGRDERLASLREQLTAAAKDLETSRVTFEDLKSRYETIVKERDLLQGQLAGVTGERDGLRKRADELAQGKQEVERSVSRLRERLALLDRDYRRITDEVAQLRAAPLPTLSVIGAAGPATAASSGTPPPDATAPIAQTVVELPPIVVRKDQAGMAVPVRGRVLEVNEPHGFLIVDKGSMDGARVGMAFDIVRGANTVGYATVVRVRPQISACNIVRAKTPGPLQSGDLAVQSGP